MKDRELLELAAEAAGLSFDPTFFGKWGLRVAREHDQGDQFDWNPLVDDGQALRLAVALCLPLDITDEVTEICPLGILEEHGSDPLAATRRAIVRAGAEMGRRMS